MKRIFWGASIVLVFLATAAFADSVTYTLTSAKLNIFPNDGTGENAGLTIQGGGVSLQMTIGTPYDWLNVFSSFAPGSSGLGSTTLFIDSVDAGHIGSFGIDDLQFDSSATLFVSSFTFPTNGKSFTVYLPASISNLTGTTSTGQQFTLVIPSGKLKISFNYDPSSGLYFPTGQATYITTPEPGTIVLMGTGLLLTLGFVRRKRLISS